MIDGHTESCTSVCFPPNRLQDVRDLGCEALQVDRHGEYKTIDMIEACGIQDVGDFLASSIGRGWSVAARCSVLQSFAVCCSELQ